MWWQPPGGCSDLAEELSEWIVEHPAMLGMELQEKAHPAGL